MRDCKVIAGTNRRAASEKTTATVDLGADLANAAGTVIPDSLVRRKEKTVSEYVPTGAVRAADMCGKDRFIEWRMTAPEEGAARITAVPKTKYLRQPIRNRKILNRSLFLLFPKRALGSSLPSWMFLCLISQAFRGKIYIMDRAAPPE